MSFYPGEPDQPVTAMTEGSRKPVVRLARAVQEAGYRGSSYRRLQEEGETAEWSRDWPGPWGGRAPKAGAIRLCRSSCRGWGNSKSGSYTALSYLPNPLPVEGVV